MATSELTGADLTPWSAVRLGRSRTPLGLGDAARERMRRSATAVRAAAGRRPVYGRTTGVGANRDALTDDATHGARLLASHSTTGTVAYPADVVRIGLLIRVNQMAAGSSGLDPAVADAVLDLLNRDATPSLHRGAALGTGDLGALAELGLALGDAVDGMSALPLMSSNALTLAEGCLAVLEAQTLLDVVPVVAAITHVAMRGNAEAYDQRVHDARPHPGQRRAAARVRELLDGSPVPAARIQDPFGLRAFAQVLGPAYEQAAAVAAALTVDLNAGAENPLVVDDAVLHNGNWHAMPIALGLDALRLGMHSVGTLSTSRLANLVDPELTGLSGFLAGGEPASSGVMIIEYVAHDALASIRSSAQPATLGTATLSRGAEHHASFAPHSVALTSALLDDLRTVLACELVAACRAIRLAGLGPDDLAPAAVAAPLATAFAELPADVRDRSLREDVRTGRELLVRWAEAAAPPGGPGPVSSTEPRPRGVGAGARSGRSRSSA